MANSNDIAKLLGISRGTVSRALNNSAAISEKTRQKVMQAAQEMGYYPNRAARALVSNAPKKAAIAFFKQPGHFWNIVKEGIAFAYDDLRHFGFELAFYESELNEPEAQLVQLAKMVEDGAQAIAIAPNDPTLMDAAIARLHQDGFPIFTFNVDIPSRQRICYVGCDYYREGRLAGELLARLLVGKGTVGVLTFRETVVSIAQRVTGFCEYMYQYPDIDMISLSRLNRDGSNAYRCTIEFLDKYPSVSGLFVSFSALEDVSRALTDKGLAKKIKLVGYDMPPAAEELLSQEIVQYVVCQEPANQGYYTTKLLFNLLLQNQRPDVSDLYTKMEVISKENISNHTHQIMRLSSMKSQF